MSWTYFDSVKKIWSGSKLPSIYNSDVNLGYLLLNILQNTPDAITQINADSEIVLTCRQIYQKSINIASHLQQLNYNQGDVAGFIAANTDDLAPTVFACLTLGLPINTLTSMLSESEMISVYSNTKPKLIFCDANVVQKVTAVVRQLPTNCVIFTLDKKVGNYGYIGDIASRHYDIQKFIMPLFDSDSLAFIMATSGTTSEPKQVCKSHKEVIQEFTFQWKSTFSAQEIWYCFTNIYFITGVKALLLGTLYGGKRIITARPFEPNHMLKIINKFNVTTMIIAPVLLAKLLSCERGELLNNSMEVLCIGGQPLSKLMYGRAKLFFPNCEVCHIYGCSEGGALSMNLSKIKCESVGQLYGNILDDSGNHLGPNESGEILYRNEVIFSGYLNDARATAETIKDGWVALGDVGYFDEDGFLFIVDRKKNIFRYEFVKVSATELESIINEVNDVSESCVTGVYQDDIGSDLIFAFVVKKSNSELTEKYVEDYVSERAIDNKKIRGGVYFVDCLPMTASGKVRRGEVKNWAVEKYKKMKS